MSEFYKEIEQISNADLKGNLVAELSDRPNQTTRFGKGLTAEELKSYFDKFPQLVKEKINEIIGTFSDKEATQYIRMPEDEEKSLYEFLSLFGKQDDETKSIANSIYAMYALKNETEKNPHSLGEILAQIAEDIAALKEISEALPPSGGGDEGEDEGGTTPTPPPEEEDPQPGEYIEETFSGSSLAVPEGVGDTAIIASVGSYAKVSKNIYPSTDKFRSIDTGFARSERFYPEIGKKYDFYLGYLPRDTKVYFQTTDSYSIYNTLIYTESAGNSGAKVTVTIPESEEKNYWLGYSTNPSIYITPPIIVPHGEPPLTFGENERTLIEGYVNGSYFYVNSDSFADDYPSFGYGYPSHPNTLDFVNGKYVQNVVAIEDDGEWEREGECVYKKTDSISDQLYSIETKDGTNADSIYCGFLRPVANAISDSFGNCISVRNSSGNAVVRIKLTEDLSIEDFKDYVKKIKLFYMILLKEPRIVDCNEIKKIDSSIDLSPNTDIRLTNEDQSNYHETTVRFLKV